LGWTVYLPLGQVWPERVKVEQINPAEDNPSKISVVVPMEEKFVAKFCNFQECLCRGKTEFQVLLDNWGTEQLTISREQTGRCNKLGVVVPQTDPVWEDNSEIQIWLCTAYP